MRNRGMVQYCDLIANGEISVVNTDYDNWNGGTYGYTVSLNLPVKLYSSLQKAKVDNLEQKFGETLNEVTKAEQNIYFNVQVSPQLAVSDIDWSILGGESSRQQLKADTESIRDILISVATGGARIQDVDDRYKKLHHSISSRCKKINISYSNTFDSLWDWYSRWRTNLPTYQSRRDFVRELLAPTVKTFDSNNENILITETIINLDEWERIKRTVLKIKVDSSKARNEEDFQQIGLLCREVIISLAQVVYKPEIHGTEDDKGTKIGKTDAYRMISNYLSLKLSGSSNEISRKFAKSTNDLANMLTHKRDAHKTDMMMSISATIALINFIGILEGKW